MSQSDKLCLCMKISQAEWIDSLRAGNAWFGKIDNYILQAERSGNNEQGDKYEGFFARCLKTSPIVSYNKDRFGDDLEIVDDGEYVLLRRKSSRKFCAFCMYGIRYSDLILIGDVDLSGSEPTRAFKYDIDRKMYDGFLQDGSASSTVTGFYCSAGHLIDALESTLNAKGYKWSRECIKYDMDPNASFYFEPSGSYPELWHKRKDLSYQHEVRIVVFKDPSPEKGICIKYPPLTSHSANIAQGELYIKGTAILPADKD